MGNYKPISIIKNTGKQFMKGSIDFYANNIYYNILKPIWFPTETQHR